MLLCRSTKLILIFNCFIRLLYALSPTLRALPLRSYKPTVHASSDINRILKTHLCNVRFTSKGGDAGNDFFSPGDGGGYVPSGLTREQYEKIKKEERDKQKKMNFGAWGPRFSKSDRPTGDWMVVPSLWVTGFTNNPLQRDTKLSPPGEKPTTERIFSMGTLTKTALGFAMLDISLAITYILHKNRGASLVVMSLFKIKRISCTVPIKAILKYTLLKFIIGSLLVNFTISLTERMKKYNRGSYK